MTPYSFIIPVSDLDASVGFFRDVVGLKLKFRDGDRYAAFDMNGFTLALLAGEERVADQATLGFRVDDLDAAMAACVKSGAVVLREAEEGPHESRGVLALPGGGVAILSQKRV